MQDAKETPVDSQIVCKSCGLPFTFSAAEAAFYQVKGLVNLPKRCKACRQQRRAQTGRPVVASERFPAVCADCQKETTVPFQPDANRPSYCPDCYNQHRKLVPERKAPVASEISAGESEPAPVQTIPAESVAPDAEKPTAVSKKAKKGGASTADKEESVL